MNTHAAVNTYSREVETLMDIAVGLSEFTQFPERCEEIPAYLCNAFQIQLLTLAILRRPHDYSDPKILHCSSSQTLVDDEATLQKDLLAINNQTLRLWENAPEAQPGDSSLAPACSYHEIALPHPPAFPLATILVSAIDAGHRIMLVIHRRPADPPVSAVLRDRLLIMTQELAKQLRPMIVWQTSPERLAKPFNLLSEREWLVLRGLNSDVCEKQLATHLEMCQHTLHSHIKSIYRKIGVQGRLQLLLRFNSLLREMRMQSVNPHWSATQPQRELDYANA